jgi:hypothetical protein
VNLRSISDVTDTFERSPDHAVLVRDALHPLALEKEQRIDPCRSRAISGALDRKHGTTCHLLPCKLLKLRAHAIRFLPRSLTLAYEFSHGSYGIEASAEKLIPTHEDNQDGSEGGMPEKTLTIRTVANETAHLIVDCLRPNVGQADRKTG